MKNTFLLLVMMAVSFSQAFAQTLAENTTPELKWEKTIHDFGNIPQDVPAKVSFKLMNTSNQPMIIQEVKGSCGCTATAHTEEAIAPGESTVISATYNARKLGVFNKTVSVTTNLGPDASILRIKGAVVEQDSK